ncbi:DUF317 domain-containing protein [Streptomyces pseudovenezuelae]|uniref:DUF317 domain-containing protein n=1 Tax=Streptomyces pseudovenezuelae TaxID=67350 RepID=UPI002E32E3F6|nr:DUF317 domain-containing protein [Streptomyces pseudovenezuelae]
MLHPAGGHSPDVLGPLPTAGWTTACKSPTHTAVSPDGLVHFTEVPTPDPATRPWHVTCTVEGYRWWTAAFSTDTPPAIAAAFTGSLARNEALPRMAIGTPLHGCGPYTRITQTSHGYADERALLEARITQARGHRLTPPAPAAGPGHVSLFRAR